MQRLNGRFFDGLSSKPQQVQILCGKDVLYIVSTTGETEDVNWLLGDCYKGTFSASGHLIVRSRINEEASLELKEEAAKVVEELLNADETLVDKSYTSFLKLNPVAMVVTGVFSMIGLLALYVFYVSPWVAERAVAIIPQQVEVTLGKAMMNQFRLGSSIDEEKSAELQRFFDACEFPSTYPIEVHYMEGPMVNAFAAPGGQLVVYEGLINESECWDELAGVLSHELAHVESRHSFKMLCRSLSSYILLSYITGDIAGISGVVLENANQLNELSYNRAYEKEADLVGLEFMKQSRMRPEALSDFFEKLSVGSEIEDGVWTKRLELLSTHPMGSTRRAYILETIADDAGFEYEPDVRPELEDLWSSLRTGDEGINTMDEVMEYLQDSINVILDQMSDEEYVPTPPDDDGKVYEELDGGQTIHEQEEIEVEEVMEEEKVEIFKQD